MDCLKICLLSLLFLLFACSASRLDIAKQQALVTDLKLECVEKKVQKACDRLPAEKEKLLKMINRKF